MSLGGRLVAGTGRLTGRAGVAAGRAATGQVQRSWAVRGSRAAAGGVLGPGDAPPPPGSADVLDYRGLARPRSLRALDGGQVPLGWAVDVRRGARHPIGLPPAALSRHAAVLGTSGSGKTSSIIVPWITAALLRGEHVVAVDVSGDLLNQVVAHQQRTSPVDARVVSWDFTRPSASASWNWLLELDTEESYASVAEALVGRARPGDPQPFFGQRDRRLLAALLRAVTRLQPTSPSSELVTACARDQEMLRTVASLTGDSGRQLVEATRVDAWDYQRVMSGVVNAVEFLDHSGVRSVTSHDQLRIGPILASDTPTLVIVSAPLHAGPMGISTSSLFLSLLISRLYRRFGQQGRHRVNLMIDEAARVRDRIDLEEVLSMSRRASVSVTLALQTVEQITDEAERHAVLDNCQTLVYLPSPSPGSAEYFQRRLGHRQVPVVGLNREFTGWSRPGGRGVNRSMESRPALGLRELMSPPWAGVPGFVHAPEVVAAPFAVDLTRPDLL